MDERRELTAAGRIHCRRIIQRLFAHGLEADEVAKRVKEYWWGFPTMIAYSLAYIGAVSTAEPIELGGLRDSRS